MRSENALFPDHFYEYAVGEFAFDEVNDAVLDQAFEDLAGGLGGRRSFLYGRRAILRQPRRIARSRGALISDTWPLCPAHALIHGVVGELVGFLVTTPKGVCDLKSLESSCKAFGFFPKRDQTGIFDLVDTLHLLDHQLGIGDHAQAPGTVLNGPLEDGDEAGVFGEVVGLTAQVIAEAGYNTALRVFDNRAIAGGARIAAGAAVTVGDKPARGGGSRRGVGKGKGIHRLQCTGAWGYRGTERVLTKVLIQRLSECGQLPTYGVLIPWQLKLPA